MTGVLAGCIDIMGRAGRIMKVVAAPDSFKGSMPASAAAECIRRGLLRAGIETVACVPLADGGEGTVEALVAATGGAFRSGAVTGPLGEPVTARWGVLGDGETAVIEMAAASGLTLVSADRRDPMRATTYGAGQLIRLAAAAGCGRILLGIGGSATNDGGAGMAQALGYRLLDENGRDLPPGGGALSRLRRIDASGFDAAGYGKLDLRVACDVTNPLCGPSGASAVYGPQKGADTAAVRILDQNLARFAAAIRRDLGVDVLSLPGGGAAGGLGAGLAAFLGARLEPGVEIVLDGVDFDGRIDGAGCVITGEGRTDGQTLFGKVPLGVARRAGRKNIPVVCLSGGLDWGYEELYQRGFTALLSIVPGPCPLEEALRDGEKNLERTAEAVGRMLMIKERKDPSP